MIDRYVDVEPISVWCYLPKLGQLEIMAPSCAQVIPSTTRDAKKLRFDRTAYDRNESYQKNVILNKIDLHDQPFRKHRSPPNSPKFSPLSRQNFSDSKNSKIWQISDISDLIIECFGRNKSCHKWYFKQDWSPWSTFQDALFSP